MFKQQLLAATGAFFCVIAINVNAQATPALNKICADSNLGSAIGNAACYSAKLKQLEVVWKRSIQMQKQEKKEQSNNLDGEYVDRIVEAEAKTWRLHLKAKCELEVAGTAGMSQWDGAYALHCEYSGIQKRLAQIKARKS